MKIMKMSLLSIMAVVFTACGGGGGDEGAEELKELVVDGQTIDVSQLTNNTDIWVVKNVNQAEVDRLTQYAKQQLDPDADILVANVSCSQLGAYEQQGTSESLSNGLIDASTYFFQNSGRPDNNFYCKEYTLSANAARYGDSSFGNLTVAIGGWNNNLDQSLHNSYFESYTGQTNQPAANVIELIPNQANAEINASNPVDIDGSTVVSKDQQTIVLANGTSVSVDSPLFINGLYQGIIDSEYTNADGTITVTLRDAQDLAEIIDTLSIEVDTTQGVISTNTSGGPSQKLSGSISGSPVQKLSASNISLYDSKNTKNMSYSLRNDKIIEGTKEPVLRIDIPENYQIPVPVKNEKLDCTTLDASCTGTFAAEEIDRLNLGETATQNGITFSTEGSFIEIGLGMTMKIFADINTFSDDVFTFDLNQSAYFESVLNASVTGDLSADLEKEIPLTQAIPVRIRISPLVSATVELQPILIIGANGEIKGKVAVSSHMLRKGVISFKFDSKLAEGNQLQQSESVEFIPTNINEDGVTVDINASGNAYATAAVKMIPSISVIKIMDINLGNVRGGIKSSASLEGSIGAGFEIVNDQASTNLDATARLWVEMYPTIDYKLDIGIDPIGLDPISFYSQNDYALLYQGDAATIFDWQVSLLADPKVIQAPTSSGDTNVTFDIEANASIKSHIKFYYTTDGSDPIESIDNPWDGSPITVIEGTIIKVKAVLHVSDYSTSLWSFGTSTSRTITEEIVPSECPGVINAEGVCIVSTYYDSGVLWTETPYVNGVIHGIVKEYYSYGVKLLKYETPYENGLKHGTERLYESGGHPLRETPYENGLKHGIEKVYASYSPFILANEVLYEKGIKLSLKIYNIYNGGYLNMLIPYNADGQIHGMAINYNSNGDIYQQTPYENGLKHGIEKIYYTPSLTPKSITPYVHGIKHGIEILYKNDLGLPTTETTYVNGVKDGLFREYYTFSGVRKREVTWKDNIYIIGSDKHYYDVSGNIESIMPYDENSVLNGSRIEYWESGYIDLIYTYVNNEIEGDVIQYYRDSTAIWFRRPHKNSVLNGIVREYYPNGDLKSTETFVNGYSQYDKVVYEQVL